MSDPTTAQRVLDTPMQANDADAGTVREYLVRLLATVWAQEADFSGKRPFGNSSWQDEIYKALLIAGLVDGAFDEDGCLDRVDQSAADALVADAIEALGAPDA